MTNETPPVPPRKTKRKMMKSVPRDQVTYERLPPNQRGIRPVGESMEECRELLETAYVENYNHQNPTWMLNAQTAPFLGMLKHLYKERDIQPKKLTPEVLQEVIERLWTGETLSGICLDDHVPAYKNLMKWMEIHPDVEVLIEKAKMKGTHALVDAMVDIANGGALSTGDTHRDAELVKLIKWILGKRNTYYSENIKITHETERRVFVLPEDVIQGTILDDDDALGSKDA